MYKVLIKTAHCQYVSAFNNIPQPQKYYNTPKANKNRRGALILNKQTNNNIDNNKSIKSLPWSFFQNCLCQLFYQIACWPVSGGEKEAVEWMKMTVSCPHRPARWRNDEALSPGNLHLHPSSPLKLICQRRCVSVIRYSVFFFNNNNKADQIKVFQKFALLQWTCQGSLPSAKLHE